MNLYRDETKKVVHGRKKSGFAYIYILLLHSIYIYVCCVRIKERKVKTGVWKQKERWETKGNSRISYSSTYGRVVSQSHCCATPQEYEWAESSPHFIIFFRLRDKARWRAEKMRKRSDKSRATISCLRKPWKYLLFLCMKEISMQVEIIYTCNTTWYYW